MNALLQPCPAPPWVSAPHHWQPGQPNTPHSDGYIHCNILYYCAMYMCMYMYVYAITTSHHAYCIVYSYSLSPRSWGVCVKVWYPFMCAHKDILVRTLYWVIHVIDQGHHWKYRIEGRLHLPWSYITLYYTKQMETPLPAPQDGTHLVQFYVCPPLVPVSRMM